jgi:hypothetical protein
MSMLEKNRHSNKGESKAHSLAHKYDSKKMAAIVNHNYFERHHGGGAAKLGLKKTDV